MGMGYSAAFADTVEEDFVKKMCPKELKAFKKEWNACDADLSEKIELARYSDFTEELDVVGKAYARLQDAFQAKTKLSLSLDYHDSENDGSRYDNVDGWFWIVEGVTTLTPAGKKYSKFIAHSSWVYYG